MGTVYRVVASLTCKRREVVLMGNFSFSDIVLFATFIIALLTYIDKRK